MGNGMEMAQCGHPDGCCSGCSAVGAPRWARHNGGALHWWHHEGAMQGVHGDGCTPVGALRSLQCRGCPAVVAPPRVSCSGAVRAGTAAMPWAHAATAARPPPPPPPPSPRGLRAAHPAGLSPEAARKGGRRDPACRRPPQLRARCRAAALLPGGGPARPPPPTAASGEEREPGRRGKMLPPALSPD